MVDTSKALGVMRADNREDELDNFTRKLFGQFENALTAFNNSVDDGRKFSHISFSDAIPSLRFRYGNRGFELTSDASEICLSWQTGQTVWEVLHILYLEPDGAGSILVGLDGEAPAAIAPRKIVQKLFGAVVGAPELENVDHPADESMFSSDDENSEASVPLVNANIDTTSEAENGLKGLFGKEFSESPVIDDGKVETGLSRLFDSASPGSAPSVSSDTTNSDTLRNGAIEPMLTSQASSLEDAIVTVREILQNELQNCAHQGSRAFESQDMKAVEQAMNKLTKLKNLEARVAHDTDEWLEQLEQN